LGQPTRDRSQRGSAFVATVYGRTRTREPEVAPLRRPRRTRPAWAIVLSVLGSLALLVSIGGYVTVRVGLNSINDALPQQNLLGAGAAPVGRNLDGALNILLVGVDHAPSSGEGSHSDTVIIMHIPASHDRAYMVSIPRDTSVDIPAIPKTNFGGGSFKVNAAFTFGSLNGRGDVGGFQLLAATLKSEWGLSFDAGAIVNFNGFKDIVTELGGVDMYVDETVYSIHRGHNIATGQSAAPYHINPDTGVPICSDPSVTFDSDPIRCAIPGVRPVVYAVGQRHLDAASALDFVRARDGLDGTDYARQRHQLQFIKAVMAECYSKGLSDPLKLTTFVKSVAKAFTFDGNGTEIGDWIFTLKGIKPTSLVSIKMNGGQYVTYHGPAPDSRQALNQTSLNLLKAITTDTNPNEDKVGEFISQYPSWIAR
jgi:polyisoprenyl-teichoic acid--peptidoglycan teichoic acid transferase